MKRPDFNGDEPCTYYRDRWFSPDRVFRIGEDKPKRDGRYVSRRELCAMCPMQQECLEYALTMNVDGTWGGMTQTERQQERRRRNGGKRSPWNALAQTSAAETLPIEIVLADAFTSEGVFSPTEAERRRLREYTDDLRAGGMSKQDVSEATGIPVAHLDSWGQLDGRRRRRATAAA